LHDVLPIGKDLLNGCDTAINVEVAGVKGRGGINTSPNDWGEIHGSANGTHTVVNITIRGSHRDWSNTKNIINDLSGPAKFSDYLLICQSGERIMAPSVNADLMTTKIFFLKKSREGNDSRSHNKHSREEVGLAEI